MTARLGADWLAKAVDAWTTRQWLQGWSLKAREMAFLRLLAELDDKEKEALALASGKSMDAGAEYLVAGAEAWGLAGEDCGKRRICRYLWVCSMPSLMPSTTRSGRWGWFSGWRAFSKPETGCGGYDDDSLTRAWRVATLWYPDLADDLSPNSGEENRREALAKIKDSARSFSFGSGASKLSEFKMEFEALAEELELGAACSCCQGTGGHRNSAL